MWRQDEPRTAQAWAEMTIARSKAKSTLPATLQAAEGTKRAT